jgi:cytochrome c peroxidase
MLFPFSSRNKTLLAAAVLALGASLLPACQGNGPDLDADLEAQLDELLMEASEGQGRNHYIMPASDDLAAIPQDPNNPLTPEKVELGKFLFHEPGINLDPKNNIGARTASCASCHFAQAGFQANRPQGLGEGGLGFGLAGEARYTHPLYGPSTVDVQPIRTPSAMNLAWHECVLWNGQFGATGINEGTEYAWTEDSPIEANYFGFQGLESQALGGQHVHGQEVDVEILTDLGYKELIEAAFPDMADNQRYHRVAVGLAMAAYERTLMANESPFQNWLKGDADALTANQKRGAILFFGKGDCASCHNGPALANMEFYALGMNDLSGPGVFNANPVARENRGRGGFTSNPDELYQFKVPQLYNLKDSPFYGHGSSFTSVADVIRYKNNAEKENTNVPDEYLSDQFVPLGLSEQEIALIADFIENGLYDPNLMRYVPSELPSGLCFPNNDPISRSEGGCD